MLNFVVRKETASLRKVNMEPNSDIKSAISGLKKISCFDIMTNAPSFTLNVILCSKFHVMDFV